MQFGSHPGVELRANLKSISHRCYLFEVAFVCELTKETIYLPLGCLQGGYGYNTGIVPYCIPAPYGIRLIPGVGCPPCETEAVPENSGWRAGLERRAGTYQGLFGP